MGELRSHVAEELGDPNAVLIMDASTFAKKAPPSPAACNANGRGDWENSRQLPGRRLPKGYAATGGHAPLDRRLYLPKEWADDEDRREEVPRSRHESGLPGKSARIALKMIEDHGKQLPHGWVAGDDEFG